MSDLELTMMRRVGELNKENARLKAEVERLEAWKREAETQLKLAEHWVNQSNTEVERLTKAGDEMAFMINESFDFPPNTPQPYIDAYLLLGIKKWVSAKEGKPGA